jgi:hypothetical protein
LVVISFISVAAISRHNLYALNLTERIKLTKPTAPFRSATRVIHIPHFSNNIVGFYFLTKFGNLKIQKLTFYLTAFDFAEWGDANNPRYYNVMKSYCPITNLRHQQYPHMFVTAGLNDPRVSYWEPAKYVAKLRTIKRDLKEDALTSPRGAVPRVESDTCQTETSSADSLLMFKTKMEGGHFSSGGVKGRLEEVSQKWAFLLAAVEDAI